MKYIIAELSGLKLPVVFPDLLSHADVAEGLVKKGAKITTAGFVEAAYADEPSKSDSLGIGSHIDDGRWISIFLDGGDTLLLAAQTNPPNTDLRPFARKIKRTP